MWSLIALNFCSVKEDAQVALNGLHELLKVLGESADFFAPLKATVGGLLFCIQIYQVWPDRDYDAHSHLNLPSENIWESQRDGWVDEQHRSVVTNPR
jgi:hypothetical protein